MSTTAQHRCTQRPAYASRQHTHTRGSKHERTQQQIHTHQARSTTPASAGGPDTGESRDWEGDRAGHGRRWRGESTGRRWRSMGQQAIPATAWAALISSPCPVCRWRTSGRIGIFLFFLIQENRYSRDARITGVSCVSCIGISATLCTRIRQVWPHRCFRG